MHKVKNQLTEKRIVDYPSFEYKQILTQGYLYIIKDKAFPLHFKVGMTRDLSKRLLSYNSDKPYHTSAYTHISKPFVDVVYAEQKLLDMLYSITAATTLTKEWFDITHYDTAIDLIKQCEDTFQVV